MADSFAEATTEWGAESTTLLELMKLLSGIGDTSQDVTLSMYLEIAGTAAEGYIDNIIRQRAVVQNIAKARTPVRLLYGRFMSLTSVMVNGDDVTSQFEAFREGGQTYLASSRTEIDRASAFKQMSITYVAGFDPLPTDLAYAIVRTAMTYEDSDFSGAARRETVVGVGTIEYGSGGQGSVVLPPTATTVLDRYRNWSA